MSQEMITGGQVGELVKNALRLTKDEYQNRRWWLEQLTDSNFNLDALANVLTPSTFGTEIKLPFPGAILVADGPGDDDCNIANLVLRPILTAADPDYITMEEAVRRGAAHPDTHWGERLAFQLQKEGNAGTISTDIWPVGIYIVCSKTIWRHSGGSRSAWYVVRDGVGFDCYFHWFDIKVSRYSRFPSFAK